MAQVRLINRFGNVVGWNKVSTKIMGRTLEGITELSYGDETEDELVYGAGGMPVGKGKGNYKPKPTAITLMHEEKIAILKSLPQGMRIQDIPDFDIVVSFEYNNIMYKEVIRNCSFRNNGTEVKQGDKSIAYKFELLNTHVDYNV